MKYLDKTGLTYFWSKVKNAINGVKPVATSITISTSDWSNNTCVKTVSGMTSTKTVIITAGTNTFNAYIRANVRASSQGTNTLTFTCDTVPTTDVDVNILVFAD